MFDRNKAELLSKEELRKRIAPCVPLEIKEKTLPSYLKGDLYSAIIQSPPIALFTKKIIKSKK